MSEESFPVVPGQTQSVEAPAEQTPEDPGPLGLAALSHHQRPVARLLYRASQIIKLDRKHPGLRALVDERLTERVSQTAILKEVEERYGVCLSRSVLSRYWQRQAGPEENDLHRLYKEMRTFAKVVMEEARKHPGSDAWKLVTSLVEMYIYESRLKLGEADVMALLTEQRRRKELEIKRGHLEVAVQKLENEKKELDSRLETDRARRDQILGAVKNAESALADGQPFDPADVYAKISAVIGSGAAEERVES